MLLLLLACKYLLLGNTGTTLFHQKLHKCVCLCIYYLAYFVVVSEVSATTTLTASGPLCAGQTAVLTCTVTEGISIRWTYRGNQFGGLITPSQPPPSGPIPVSGVEFTLSLLEDSSPDLVSQLTFTASTDMDGEVVACIGIFRTGPDGMRELSTSEIMLEVQQNCKPACDVISRERPSYNSQGHRWAGLGGSPEPPPN